MSKRKREEEETKTKTQRKEKEKEIKVLCAFDKFKDSLNAQEVGKSVLDGLEELSHAFSLFHVLGNVVVMADGGDGFLKALNKSLQLGLVELKDVPGPEGTPISTRYGLSADGTVAVIEMAEVAGLHLVPSERRNPLNTTTHGVGILIQDAVSKGAKKIILGVGGSATNDGGLGALSALGVSVHVFGTKKERREEEGGQEENGKEEGEEGKERSEIYVPKMVFGKHLLRLSHLEVPKTPLIPPHISFEVAVDVVNPFTGPNGATKIFGPQKGATPAIQEQLEQGMEKLSKMYNKFTPSFTSSVAGSGAAGGLSGGVIALLGAIPRKGVEIVAKACDLERKIVESDIVFSGEGRYDAQTASGKSVNEVQRLCQKHGKPLVILCGSTKDLSSAELKDVYSLISLYDLKSCMTKTRDCLIGIVRTHIYQFPLFSETFNQ